jgi:hypothetical protein
MFIRTSSSQAAYQSRNPDSQNFEVPKSPTAPLGSRQVCNSEKGACGVAREIRDYSVAHVQSLQVRSLGTLTTATFQLQALVLTASLLRRTPQGISVGAITVLLRLVSRVLLTLLTSHSKEG